MDIHGVLPTWTFGLLSAKKTPHASRESWSSLGSHPSRFWQRTYFEKAGFFGSVFRH
jgi:hypothetical protein